MTGPLRRGNERNSNSSYAAESASQSYASERSLR